MDSLVSTQWLADRLGTPGLRLLDATFILPDYGRDAEAEHRAGHIPGAVFVPLDAVSDHASPYPHMLPAPAEFARAIGAAGVGDGDTIVVYDNSPHHSAARLWWMLRIMGAADVAILDGGLAKWKAEGRPLATGLETPEPRAFTPRFDPAPVRDLAAMRTVVDAHAQIVDARSATRFAGTAPEPRYGVAPGHIPGSRNVPQDDLFLPDNSFKRDITLRAAFEDAGVEVDRPVIATCGSGVTAAVLVFGLHLLGHDAALYDGSWSEWGAQADTPKATAA